MVRQRYNQKPKLRKAIAVTLCASIVLQHQGALSAAKSADEVFTPATEANDGEGFMAWLHATIIENPLAISVKSRSVPDRQIAGTKEKHPAAKLQEPPPLDAVNLQTQQCRVRTLASYMRLRTQGEIVPREFDADIISCLELVAVSSPKRYDDSDGYLKWWNRNKVSLMTRWQGEWLYLNVETILASTYIHYKVETTKDDKEGFSNWIRAAIEDGGDGSFYSNAVFHAVSAATEAASFTGDLAKGALIAGPIAGLFTAYLMVVMTPLNERMRLAGNRHLGRFGVWLKKIFFVPSAAAKMKFTPAQVEALQKVLRMSPDEFKSFDIMVKELWIAMEQGLNSSIPPGMQQGRNLFSDAFIFRMKDFAGTFQLAMTAATTNLQMSEASFSRMLAGKSQEQQAAIDRLTQDLGDKNFEKLKLEKAGQSVEQVSKEMFEISRMLETHGVRPSLIDQFLHYRTLQVGFLRTAITGLSAHILHDGQFFESTVDIPPEAQAKYDKIREHWQIDYFRDLFWTEIQASLKELDIEIGQIKKIGDEAKRGTTQKPVDPANLAETEADKEALKKAAGEGARTSSRLGELKIQGDEKRTQQLAEPAESRNVKEAARTGRHK